MTDLDLLEQVVQRMRSQTPDKGWYSLLFTQSETGLEEVAQEMGFHCISVASVPDVILPDEVLMTVQSPLKSSIYNKIPEPDKIRAA